MRGLDHDGPAVGDAERIRDIHPDIGGCVEAPTGVYWRYVQGGPVILEDIKELSDDVKASSKTDRLYMSFSTGVDSIAMWLRCLESGAFDPAEAVLYYMYYIPDVPWIEEYIGYFQAKYGVKIIQVPSPILLKDLANWLYQPPARVAAIRSLETTDKRIMPIPRDDIEAFVRRWAGLPDETYCAVGVKSGDSAMRRLQMRKMRGINRVSHKWYPIWDFENRDCETIIRRHEVKVPFDYELFGITFENIDYRFSRVIKDRCPATWAKILDFFPLAETILTRHEYYHPDWYAKKGVKIGRYRDMVLQPEVSV
jgi:hypothetical protein